MRSRVVRWHGARACGRARVQSRALCWRQGGCAAHAGEMVQIVAGSHAGVWMVMVLVKLAVLVTVFVSPLVTVTVSLRARGRGAHRTVTKHAFGSGPGAKQCKRVRRVAAAMRASSCHEVHSSPKADGYIGFAGRACRGGGKVRGVCQWCN